jgi:hypothetical protein
MTTGSEGNAPFAVGKRAMKSREEQHRKLQVFKTIPLFIYYLLFLNGMRR